MDLGLTDKIALVAASSRGLGRAIAEEFAAEGVHLVLCARTAAGLDEARRAIREQSEVDVLAYAVDLSEPSGVDSLIDASLERFGRIDVLVTNTGGPPAGTFEAHDAAAWDAAVRQNLNSVVNLTRAVLPGMKSRRWGRILNVTSIAVKQPVDNLMLSNSVRAAVTGFAKTLANEVARDGITVNNLLPGYTRTQRLEDLESSVARTRGCTREEVRASWEREIPAARLGEPREFAALAAFLASERASYITGTSIPVDGGWTRSLF